ncbi:MAG TPA: ABC transporter ATP-binding protein [Pseudolabrys sp.]|nr:ABC transporter ATP-binding protein [Pseudolabrys sp.]
MLELINLCVSYGRVKALRGVSLKIANGCIFVVLGANGAGKSTLLRAILGLSKATGVIRFDGSDITGLATFERVRRGIALVPEGRRLFPDFTVEENLKIGALNRRDHAAIEDDLEEIYVSFPRLKERLRQRAQTLSGGEGQMLAIARALISRPKLLLLDEPSVGLMPIAVSDIFAGISKISIRKGLTVLLVEQNAKKALDIAKEAAVLELGSLVIEADAEALKSDARVQEAYLGGH